MTAYATLQLACQGVDCILGVHALGCCFAVVDKLNARRDALLSEAKATLGMWSEAGVADTRSMFW